LVAPSTTRRAHPERNAAVFRMKSKDARRSAQGAKMTTIGECTHAPSSTCSLLRRLLQFYQMENRQRVILFSMGLVNVILLAVILFLIFTPPNPTKISAARTVTATLTTGTPTLTPTLGPTPTPSFTFTPPATAAPLLIAAKVSADGDGLRLRQQPGTAGAVLGLLSATTPLTATGRTDDDAWMQVTVSDGRAGWVLAQYVEAKSDLTELPVTGQVVNASLPLTPPYISGITANARQIFLTGQSLGNRANAFALVGDSNTDNPAFLAPFDRGSYDLGAYGYLKDTLIYFAGSFARHSPAAVGSFSTSKVLDPAYADSRCQAGESPLVCEYRLQKPSISLILIGTGDQHTWQGFEARYRQIVEYTLAQGIIPVLITKADDLESVENTAPPGYTNAVITRLSGEYQVPLLDLRQAIDPLPKRGLKQDGFHYNLPPDGRTTYFTGDDLNYGFTIRNLTALQMLDALRQEVMYGGR